MELLMRACGQEPLGVSLGPPIHCVIDSVVVRDVDSEKRTSIPRTSSIRGWGRGGGGREREKKTDRQTNRH